MRHSEFSKHEWPNTLIVPGSCRIFRSCHVLVMSFNMLIHEYRVEVLGVDEHTQVLVPPVLTVDQFVTSCYVHRGYEAHQPTEGDELRNGFGSYFTQIEWIEFNIITKYAEWPDPSKGFGKVARVKRNNEPPVFHENPFVFPRKVLLIYICFTSLQEMRTYNFDIGDEKRYHPISRKVVRNMS